MEIISTELSFQAAGKILKTRKTKMRRYTERFKYRGTINYKAYSIKWGPM
jgi:hypothetical protein